MSDVEQSIDELASVIAKDAARAEHIGDKIEALKVLTAYFAAKRKHGAKAETDDGGPNFEDMTRELGSGRNSGSKLPS